MEFQSNSLNKTIIIAEIGVNHNGSIKKALELIDIAYDCGVDIVKFQTFKAENVATKDAPKASYQLKVTSRKESQLNMLKKLELKKEDYPILLQKCNDLGIGFMSTPYDIDDAKFLVSLGVKKLKIASGQLVEYYFLEAVAKICDDIILSTGMGNMREVEKAIKTIKLSNPKINLCVLQCTTNYPSQIENANVKAMLTFKNNFDVDIGYSDHVPNNYAAFAAVALGAKVIEKHITYDKLADGPDHSSSLNPDEFKDFVNGIRNIELSLGSGVKTPSFNEIQNTKGMRRSLVYKNNMKKGEKIVLSSIKLKRPQNGLISDDIPYFLEKTLKTDVQKDQNLEKKHV